MVLLLAMSIINKSILKVFCTSINKVNKKEVLMRLSVIYDDLKYKL